MKYLKLSGTLECPGDSDVYNQFIELIESKGFSYGGGMQEMDEDGNAIPMEADLSDPSSPIS